MAVTIRRLLCGDWAGGVVAATTDPIEMLDRLERPPNTPVSLLMAQGFEVNPSFQSLCRHGPTVIAIEDLHPFVPIHVPNYSEAEAESFFEFCLSYNWITVKPTAPPRPLKAGKRWCRCRRPKWTRAASSSPTSPASTRTSWSGSWGPSELPFCELVL